MGSVEVLWLGTAVALGEAVAWSELVGCRSAAPPKPPATAVAAAATPTSATPPATTQRRALMPRGASPMPDMRRGSGIDHQARARHHRVRGRSRDIGRVGRVGGQEGEVPIALPVRLGQALLRLPGTVERLRGSQGVAGVVGVVAVDRRAVIGCQGQEGADPIHGSEDTQMKIPATTYFPRELPPEYLRRWRA